MSEKKRLTIYQKLDRVFGKDGIKSPTTQTNKYSIGGEELLRTTSKSEFEQAKLQNQQTKYLSQTWKKVDGQMYQQSVHYEVTRIGSYSDFENMEFYPEIAAALDIMAEESTTVNDKGRILNIYSESKRIKAILEDLFYNRLDIHTTLLMWTRNTAKYGDNFLYLNLDDKKGILGARQMPNFEMERHEGDLFDALSSRNRSNFGRENAGDASKVTFRWRGKDVEFNSWQIIHFRLLGDDRKLPYGTSILEKARRIWKQLLLSEDAMLIYRITRAPERRIFKVYVGNIDDQDVEPYVNQIANRFKRTPVVDPQTGQIDLRYNQLAQDQDYFIPVRDENSPNPIDTLPGASNLSEIADIEYLQAKLFTALRVPKTFLGFEEATGDGKNLALQDVRFSRTINRIQQAMIRGLNEMAILHLYMMGFDDDIDNFTITLNNPSTQAEMLKIEHLQQKITAYVAAVVDAGNGFGAMSMTRAKRDILGMSDDEIRQDLLEQRMEKAAAAELAKTEQIIKHTGYFDTVDRIYGEVGAEYTDGEDAEGAKPPKGGGGGGFGGGGLGGEDLDFGDTGEESETPEGSEDEAIGGAETETPEVPEAPDTETPEGPANTEESKILKVSNLLTERKKSLTDEYNSKKIKYKGIYFDKLIKTLDKDKAPDVVSTKIWDKNIRINESIQGMIDGVDDMLKE